MVAAFLFFVTTDLVAIKQLTAVWPPASPSTPP